MKEQLADLRVLVMAGGTGGHVYPALAVAQRLAADGANVTWLGTAQGLEARVVPRAGIEFHALSVRGVRGKSALGRLRGGFMLLGAIWHALRLLRTLRPHLVFGAGGYAAGPGAIAAWILRIPVCVHEQNAVPGFTNKVIARFIAARVLEAFPGSFAPARNAVHTGNPVRADIAAIAPPEQRMRERDGTLHLLVLGGSQGAKALNDTVPAAVADLPIPTAVEVWHQTGANKLVEAKNAYADMDVSARAVEFIHDMAEAYSWSDLVICRARAMTVAELAAAGTASILVPFPYAVDDHQTLNARYLSDVGAAVLVDEAALNSSMLSQLLRDFAQTRERLLEMARAAHRVSVPDAVDRVVSNCVAVARS